MSIILAQRRHGEWNGLQSTRNERQYNGKRKRGEGVTSFWRGEEKLGITLGMEMINRQTHVNDVIHVHLIYT